MGERKRKKEGKNAADLLPPCFDKALTLGGDGKSQTMPKYYRRVEIKYSRFGVEDFDFEWVSPNTETNFAPLNLCAPHQQILQSHHVQRLGNTHLQLVHQRRSPGLALPNPHPNMC